jgi:hypothetical protein
MENLLHDRFYVPVLRSEDNSVQAAVGEPFSPACPLVGTDLFLYSYLHTDVTTLSSSSLSSSYPVIPLGTQGVNKTSPSDPISGHLFDFTPALPFS